MQTFKITVDGGNVQITTELLSGLLRDYFRRQEYQLNDKSFHVVESIPINIDPQDSDVDRGLMLDLFDLGEESPA